MKHVNTFLLVALVIASLSTFAQPKRIGSTNVFWECIIDANNDTTLEITGSGNIPNYRLSKPFSPWWFFKEQIRYIKIGDSITQIGSYSFYNCSLVTSVVVPNSVKTIGTAAFARCSNMVSIVLPDSITTFPSSVFENCYKLTSLAVPDMVSTIDGYAFGRCSNMVSIVLPENLTSIEQHALIGCTSLCKIICHNPIPTPITNHLFDSVPSGCVIVVPDTAVAAYKAAANWNEYEIRGMSENTTTPRPRALKINPGCNSVTLSVSPTTNFNSYQWYKNDAIIDGATSTSLSVPRNSEDAAYYVIISSTCDAVKSNVFVHKNYTP